MTSHLRVQLTLLGAAAGGRPIPPAAFRTTLSASGRRFPAVLLPKETILPGGAAVHCEVELADVENARSFFPRGGLFELWEGTRTGYGQVLASTVAN